MERKIFNICITGARTTLNYGTLSIVTSGIEELNKKLCGAVKFTIISPSSNIDAPIYRNNINDNITIRTVGSPYYKCIPYPMRMSIVMLRSILEYFKSDLIIDMRGEGYVGSLVALSQSTQLLLAYISGKPFIIYAQSLGPFRTKLNRKLAKFTLKKAQLITIREPVSMKYFDELEITNEPYLCADQAILLNPISHSIARDMLEQLGISRTEKLIGISPVSNKRFIEMTVELTNYLIENYGTTVIYIPHAVDEKLGGCRDNDDISSAREAYDKVKNKDKVRIIYGDYTAKQLKGFMNCCEIYISFRWHAAIAAVSSNIPTIVISSAHKSAAMSMLEMDEFIIDPMSIDESSLMQKVKDCWTRRDKIKKYLEPRVDKLKKSAMKNIDLTEKVLTDDIK